MRVCGFIFGMVVLSLMLGHAVAGEWRHEELKRFAAGEARQGVAVDGEFFYAIDNFKVGKYRKDTGEKVASWEGVKGGGIQHLNAGVVLEGKLHAAHSNFPKTPEESSMEIWDVSTMKPVGSHRFEKPPGSLTWVQWHEGESSWYACFAHYAKDGGEGPEETVVVRYDKEWKQQQSWKFPKDLVAKFGKYSASCGAFGPLGKLFVTGHDARELYVLEIPKDGAELKWIDTIVISAEGQGFAWDGSVGELGEAGVLYSISRKSKEVIVSRVAFSATK